MSDSRRPIIGILPDVDTAEALCRLRLTYVRALLEAGAAPVVLPPVPTADVRRQIADGLDGLLLTGSHSDVDPQRYGESPRPGLGPLSPLREQQDWAWLETVFERGLPVLGICYGCQVLNVFLGGSLYQDIPSEVPGAVDHDPETPPTQPAHEVRLHEDSMLYRWIGRSRLMVNSSHHQGIKTLGPRVRPVAWSPDGLVEAFESIDSNPPLWGIQWHPEWMVGHDRAARAIFEMFVDVCRRRRE
jgi:putative glutamine amidotransferase